MIVLAKLVHVLMTLATPRSPSFGGSIIDPSGVYAAVDGAAGGVHAAEGEWLFVVLEVEVDLLLLDEVDAVE